MLVEWKGGSGDNATTEVLQEASQTLLTEMKLRLQRRLHFMLYRGKSHMGKVSLVGLSKQAIKW